MTENSAKDKAVEMIMKQVEEIQQLSKMRGTLNFGSMSSVRNTAESVLSREIAAKVNLVSKLIIDTFGQK